MPARGISKYATDRELEQLVQHEDSDDDDYDDREQRKSQKSRSKTSKKVGSTQPRKKQRRGGGYNGSDISDDDGEDESEEEVWTNEEDDEEPEINESTGRPARRAAKQAKTYRESDEDEDEAQSTSEEESTPVKQRRKKIVTLKIRTPLVPSSSTRSLRERKPSITLRTQSSGTRRTRRMSEDIGEDLVALSSSGRHAIVARAGSRDPDSSPRATRGSKGIKYPSANVIEEVEEEEPSFRQEMERTGDLTLSQNSHAQGLLDDMQDRPDVLPGVPQLLSDLHAAASADMVIDDEADFQHSPSLTEPGRPDIEPLSEAESQAAPLDAQAEQDDDDDDEPVQTGRATRAGQKRKADSPPAEEPLPGRRKLRGRDQTSRAISTTSRRRKGVDETSDFDPEDVAAEEADDVSDTAGSDASPRKRGSQQADDSSNGGRRSTRLQRKAASQAVSASEDEDEELAVELAELNESERKSRRKAQEEKLVFETRGRRNASKKNYDLLRNLPQIDEDEEAAPSPSHRTRKTGGGGWQRSLFPTHGPFGGAGGRSLFGGPGRPPDIDSDSSDDEIMKQPKPSTAGMVGMTPTTAQTPFNPFALNSLNSDPAQGPAGTPANLGKVKDRQALADADPLGVDQNVNFDSVGGLQGHIDQLKEMVALPLLYPEIFMRFKITPPRGVLFHGPPGTGKTLLARALATSVSSEGRKVTFYMRKGADALSKWVGEAERQLRLLFEEARKNQPSIIFFDEIDGLAPVRSSKQEQIHASIVSTLLALMDGMDGRGQVIVIGATNRPDSIDPALRRPGRFDREFYFPLPDVDARRSILNIHTAGWNPPLDDKIKDELALLTKGYGGADLRALCTEAALNAVQRRYPQIYSSKEKLLIDPKTIEVTPKDFMISIKKMTPSSERSAASGAASLPENIAPLLDEQLEQIKARIGRILPQKKNSTALEEAMFEDVADGKDFGREKMQQAFESTRVFRPRLLIHGKVGMGQQYIAAALLNHFQGIHVQSFDLATLLSDTTSSPEATVIRLFTEVKTHKPSVIYIPNVQEWAVTVGNAVLTTFFGLLRSIKPTDPIMVLGFLEADPDQEDANLKRDLFGYSQKNQYSLPQPSNEQRRKFFQPIQDYIRTRPSDFPDPAQRKRRQLEILPPAPPEAPKPPPALTKEELKAQKKRDRQTLNTLKIRLQPIMDQIRMRYKKFRTGVIEESAIRYLYDEADPSTLTSDLVDNQALQVHRPFELGKDHHGVPCLIDQATKKQYYNIDSVTIEKRLSNGYYKRPKDFLTDIKRLAKDAKTAEDEDRQLKANELLANVEVDIASIELNEPVLGSECERVYQREIQREKDAQARARANMEPQPMLPPQSAALSDRALTTTTEGTGQIRLGEDFDITKDLLAKAAPSTPSRPSTQTTGMSNGYHETDILQIQHDSNGAGSGHDADMDTDSFQNHSNGTSNQTQPTSSSLGKRSSAQPRPSYLMTAPSQQLRDAAGLSQGVSQTGFLTPLNADSQAVQYSNAASTTDTSKAHRDSGPSDHTERGEPVSQEVGPNLFLHEERRSAGGSDIPDTQYTTPSQNEGMGTRAYSKSAPSSPVVPNSPRRSRRSGNVSSPKESYLTKWVTTDRPINLHAPPNATGNVGLSEYLRANARQEQTQSLAAPVLRADSAAPRHASAPAPQTSNGRVTAFSNLLNPSPPARDLQVRSLRTDSMGPDSQNSGGLRDKEQFPVGNLILPRAVELDNAMADLADQTSGLSVEQMEQVNSVMMDILWQTRGDWDRNRVMDLVLKGFNDALADMKEVGQEFGDLSWEHRDARRATRRIEG